MSMLPPFFRGGIVLWPPGSSSATPITPGNGAMGTATAHPRVGPVGKVPELEERLGELDLGQEPPAGPDVGPAERGGPHLQDLDHEHVAGPGPLDADGSGQRVAAERAAGRHI